MADQDVELAADTRQPTETDPAVSKAPPSYRSVFKRVQRAKQESTSNEGFAKALPGIVAGSVEFAICTGLMLAIPISMVVMGAKYLNECPVQRYIPIYLIVGGITAIFVNLTGLIESVCRVMCPERKQSGLSIFCNAVGGCMGCFMMAWFIAGSVLIYSTRCEFTTTPGQATYCHPTLYWYAFWITTVVYILLGVLVVGTCVLISCCAFFCSAALSIVKDKIRGLARSRESNVA